MTPYPWVRAVRCLKPRPDFASAAGQLLDRQGSAHCVLVAVRTVVGPLPQHDLAAAGSDVVAAGHACTVARVPDTSIEVRNAWLVRESGLVTDVSEPTYRCPHCNARAGLVSSPVKAACLNEICAVEIFNPSIPPLSPLDEWERRVGVEHGQLPEGFLDDPNGIIIGGMGSEDRAHAGPAQRASRPQPPATSLVRQSVYVRLTPTVEHGEQGELVTEIVAEGVHVDYDAASSTAIGVEIVEACGVEIGGQPIWRTR